MDIKILGCVWFSLLSFLGSAALSDLSPSPIFLVKGQYEDDERRSDKWLPENDISEDDEETPSRPSFPDVSEDDKNEGNVQDLDNIDGERGTEDDEDGDDGGRLEDDENERDDKNGDALSDDDEDDGSSANIKEPFEASDDELEEKYQEEDKYNEDDDDESSEERDSQKPFEDNDDDEEEDKYKAEEKYDDDDDEVRNPIEEPYYEDDESNVDNSLAGPETTPVDHTRVEYHPIYQPTEPISYEVHPILQPDEGSRILRPLVRVAPGTNRPKKPKPKRKKGKHPKPGKESSYTTRKRRPLYAPPSNTLPPIQYATYHIKRNIPSGKCDKNLTVSMAKKCIWGPKNQFEDKLRYDKSTFCCATKDYLQCVSKTVGDSDCVIDEDGGLLIGILTRALGTLNCQNYQKYCKTGYQPNSSPRLLRLEIFLLFVLCLFNLRNLFM